MRKVLDLPGSVTNDPRAHCKQLNTERIVSVVSTFDEIYI